MRLTVATVKLLPLLTKLAPTLPQEQYVGIEGEPPELHFQCKKQADVRALRACFPGLFWEKKYNEECKWWQYRSEYVERNFFGVVRRVPLYIYACLEAPPMCRAIVEEYETEEIIPMTFETRKVKKTRTRVMNVMEKAHHEHDA